MTKASIPFASHNKDALQQRRLTAEDESVHQWYRIIMGFDWKLVQYVVELLSIGPNHVVLDPFCGAGTTLVQCKKLGIPSVGIDANPVCKLASQVKTNWQLQPKKLRAILGSIVHESVLIENFGTINSDAALHYLRDSGMIERGWPFVRLFRQFQ